MLKPARGGWIPNRIDFPGNCEVVIFKKAENRLLPKPFDLEVLVEFCCFLCFDSALINMIIYIDIVRYENWVDL